VVVSYVNFDFLHLFIIILYLISFNKIYYHIDKLKIMPSFDVISKVNYQEFDNALANCLREISNRYDFKGLNISIERKDKTITTIATDELKLKQVNELLETHLIRRKVDPRVLNIKTSEGASGGTIRQVSELKEGISQENAKKIIGDIKKLKLKIQIKIQGEELRVDGKKRDDLQDAIAAIKTIDIGLPIEFINFRD
jgi:uncharacterized protein YajQ (UPF0234 family)